MLPVGLPRSMLKEDSTILSGVRLLPRSNFTMGNKANFGYEIDGTLTYDYTEDVQISLLGGIFLPSKAINGNESAFILIRQKAAATGVNRFNESYILINLM